MATVLLLPLGAASLTLLTTGVASAQTPATIPVGAAPEAIAVDASRDIVYVANQSSNDVSVIDGTTDTVVATIPVGTSPLGVGVDEPSDTVYVSNQQSGTVSVINGHTDTVTATITAGPEPSSVGVDPTTDTVYVADEGGDTVSVIDGKTNTVTATPNVGDTPGAISVDDATDTIYVCVGSGLAVIDGSTNGVSSIGLAEMGEASAIDTTTDTIYVSTGTGIEVVDGKTAAQTTSFALLGAQGVAVDSRTGTLWVTNLNTSSVYEVNAGSGAVEDSLPAGDGTDAVAADPVTHVAYATNRVSNSVSVLDGVTDSITPITVGASPYGVAVDTVTDTVYVANTDSNTVSVIDATTGEVTGTVDLPSSPGAPSAIAVDPLTDTIYVANGLTAGGNSGEGSVSVIDGGNDTVTTTVDVGTAPDGITVDPTTDIIYVSDHEYGTTNHRGAVSVIDGSTDKVTDTITNTDLWFPGGIAADGATDTVYVASTEYNDVLPIDGANDEVGTPINLGAGQPSGLAVDESTDMIYATESNQAALAVIDGTSGEVTGTVGVGSSPAGVTIDAATGLVYVADNASGSVSVLDGSSVENTIGLTGNPQGIGVDDASKVFVADGGSTSTELSVLDGVVAPGAPLVTSPSAANSEVSLKWAAPADGNSAITSYVVAAEPASGTKAVVQSLAPADSAATVTGLRNGTTYDVTVTANNAAGAGASSTPVSLTPTGPPAAPTGVVAKSGNASASVTWKAPASDGGSPITSVDVIPYTGSTPLKARPVPRTATSAKISGLENGEAYTFVVSATNGRGTSRSKPSAAVTPATLPGAPTVKGVSGNRTVTLTWTAPTKTGGAPIEGYDVYMGKSASTISKTPVNKSLISIKAKRYLVTGRTNGTAYYFAMKAVNRVGPGAASNVVKVTPT
ncbi:MAG: fibronectin type III domain-containing protein [Acidimicrobiales bacterium]